MMHVITLSAVMLTVVMLVVVMLSVVMLIIVILSVFIMCVVMLRIVKLNVNMLSVIMPNVVMQSVVVPLPQLSPEYWCQCMTNTNSLFVCRCCFCARIQFNLLSTFQSSKFIADFFQNFKTKRSEENRENMRGFLKTFFPPCLSLTPFCNRTARFLLFHG